MNDHTDIRRDLEPGTPDELVLLAARLEQRRPLPNPGFRGRLRRHVVARSERSIAPRRLRVLLAGYAGGGIFLLAVGALSAAGFGPLH